MKQTYSIDADSSGMSLRNFIKSKHKEHSTREIEALISKNGAKINQKIERFGSTKLSRGDCVEIFPQFFKKKTSQKISVLYEDDHFIAIDKPENIPSDAKILGQLLMKKVILVHRLDKLTSGALLLAKTKEAQKKIEEKFFKREIEKTYLAIVHGRVSKLEGEIDKPLKLKKRYEGGVLYKTAPFGKPAVTYWKKVTSSKAESLLMLYPITGRTHQIRVHLDSIERPILGDPQYGENLKSTYHLPRLMLHARKLAFNHPILNKRIEIIAPIPIIFRQSISKLFKNSKKCAF